MTIHQVQIVHMTESLGGGVLQSILELSRVQQRAGYRVLVVYLERKETPSASELKRAFGDIDLLCLGNSSLKNVFRLGTFSLSIQKGQICILHAHSSWAGLALRVAATIARSPEVLYTPHSFSFERKDINSFMRAAYYCTELLLSRAKRSRILGCSHRETEVANKISNRQAVYLGNYCESIGRKYGEETPFNELNTGRIIVYGAGRICTQKNPVRFASVAKRLESQCFFSWIGDGEQSAVFDNSEILTTGWVNREKLAQYFNAGDVLLLTSDWEGLPFTVIEALSCSKPVLAFEIEGIDEYVIDGINGYIVNSIDQAEKRILELVNDPMLLETLGANAGESFKKNYDLSILEKNWEKIYRIKHEI